MCKTLTNCVVYFHSFKFTTSISIILSENLFRHTFKSMFIYWWVKKPLLLHSHLLLRISHILLRESHLLLWESHLLLRESHILLRKLSHLLLRKLSHLLLRKLSHLLVRKLSHLLLRKLSHLLVRKLSHLLIWVHVVVGVHFFGQKIFIINKISFNFVWFKKYFNFKIYIIYWKI